MDGCAVPTGYRCVSDLLVQPNHVTEHDRLAESYGRSSEALRRIEAARPQVRCRVTDDRPQEGAWSGAVCACLVENALRVMRHSQPSNAACTTSRANAENS